MNIDQIITREEFNKVKEFNYDILVSYIEKLVKLCVEESLKTLPMVMTNLSNQAGYLRGLSNDFYDRNKDLNNTESRSFMAKAMEIIEGNNPGLGYLEILNKAEPLARDMIVKNRKGFVSKNVELKTFDSKLKDL